MNTPRQRPQPAPTPSETPPSCMSPGAVPASAAAQQRLAGSRREETRQAQVSPAQHLNPTGEQEDVCMWNECFSKLPC